MPTHKLNMEVEVPKPKLNNAFHILQTTSSFNVLQMVRNTPRGIMEATQVPRWLPPTVAVTTH